MASVEDETSLTRAMRVWVTLSVLKRMTFFLVIELNEYVPACSHYVLCPRGTAFNRTVATSYSSLAHFDHMHGALNLRIFKTCMLVPMSDHRKRARNAVFESLLKHS